MKIILNQSVCLSLAGTLGRGYGYYLRTRTRKDGSVRVFSQRCAKNVPPVGHLRFIILCAEMADTGMYIKDIRISRDELRDALREAQRTGAVYALTKYAGDYPRTFRYGDILQFKKNLNL